MKVLAIVGSPRKGHTYSAVQKFEEQLQGYDKIDFDYVLLKDVNLLPCRGCGLCLERGEEYCPLKDDREAVFNRMLEADGVIFASPNYALQVSALLKNLLERLAYLFHRPCFFYRTFMPLITQGAYGDKDILKYLESVARFWGFNTCPGVALNTPTNNLLPSEQRQVDLRIEKGAKNFYNTLIGPKNPVPSIKDVMIFRLTRTIKPYIKDFMPRDYQYFQEHGWLESPYYYQTRLGVFKGFLGTVVDIFATMQGKKMKKERKRPNIG